MGVKLLRFSIFRRSTTRHALVRALVIASVLSVVPLMERMPEKELDTKNHVLDLSYLGQFLFGKVIEPFWGNNNSEKCPEVVISGVAAELMGLKLLRNDSKVLCIGQGSDLAVSVFKEKGFSDVQRVLGHPLFALMGRKHVYELPSPDNSVDVVYYGEIDEVVPVPALLVLEMERVLKPGGIAAVLVSSNGELYNSNSLVKSATSVSSLLKLSEIVHVNSMDGFTVVVFKKNVMENASSAYFGKNQLPSDCHSVVNTKPYIPFIEPLLETKPVDFPKSVAYLPKFLDISPKQRLVYIDVGATEHLSANLSSSSWFLPSYPIDSKAFNIYIVDHNTSVMLTEVKKPGVTFVYHPGLAGDNNAIAKNTTLLEDLEPFPEDEESFDFLAWFEETANYTDFLVVKMNTSEEEMKFLSGLIETGAICYVDELFLHCTSKLDCMNILQSLRSRGIFVHQWWGGD